MKTPALSTVLICSLAPLTSGCGPWLPTVLLADDKQQALHAPIAKLTVELRHLPALPKLPPGLKPRPLDEEEYQQLRTGELKFNANEEGDVAAALVFYQVPAARRAEVAAGYWRVRRAMKEIRNPQFIRQEIRQDAAEVLRALPVPPDLPGELAQYLQGAIAFHCGKEDEARAAWGKLLARPAAERRFRSTWAAYMLGRMAIWDSAEDATRRAEARGWLQRVRSLAQEGCEDALNLVGMSYFWEATVQEGDDPARTAPLYCLCLATGCAWSVDALHGIGSEILAADNESIRARAARVPLLRQLVTACIVCDFAGSRFYWEDQGDRERRAAALAGWVATLEAAGLTEVEDADRLACAAYDAGDFATAAKWLKRAPAEAPIAQWLRGKLALRAGRTAEAARDFAQAARHFPQAAPSIYADHDWWSDRDTLGYQSVQSTQLQSDLGIAQMARARFPEALDAFLRSGSWLDAAYVAEQVLTTKELLAYLRQHPELKMPPGFPRSQEENYPTPVANLRVDAPLAFRYLLARRLAREGRLDEAQAFMPERLRPWIEAYRAAYQLGHDPRRPAGQRAAALWQAARIHRYLGMELFGAETAPDWSFYNGSYEPADIGGQRAGTQPPPDWQDKTFAKTRWLPRVSQEEIARNARLRPTPNTRFHYRYVAAELAWEAARLRPADEETARMLCIAGGWLKARDPQSADRFYQELVGRCGQTILGRDGERRKWFPPVQDEPFENPLPPVDYW